MKRIFKGWAQGRQPSPPRRRHSSRRRQTSSDVRDNVKKAPGSGVPDLIPLTFLGYQHLPDGSFQPVYSAAQTASQSAQATKDDQKLVEPQHFCFKCGKARSKRYHMDNPIKPGSKPPASCCTKCRKHNKYYEPCLKYLQHFCGDCGQVRSRSYHDEHPVRPGQKPRPSYCIMCRTYRKQAGVDDWEDIDDGESILALPHLRTPTSYRLVAKNDGLAAPSESEDSEKELDAPSFARINRKVSKESAKSVRYMQPSFEEVPPTPPYTPLPSLQKQRPVEMKRSSRNVSSEKPKEGAPASSSAATQTTPLMTTKEIILSPKTKDGACSGRVHVVYVQPSCHGCHNHCSHHATRPRTDSSTTGTSSKQSRRVAFATPEVSSRHDADPDYDRTAVPENHEADPFDFGLNTSSSGANRSARAFDCDGRPRRVPTPGPMSGGFQSSQMSPPPEQGPTSYGGPSQAGVGPDSPPPEYTTPPPKLFSPDEIRRLWEQGPQPERPRRRQPQESGRSTSDSARPRDFSSENRTNYAANQRAFGQDSSPRGFSDGYRPSTSGQGNARSGNYGLSGHGRSDGHRPNDSRYKNNENIDPKTRSNGYGNSRASQPRGFDRSSENSPNMYNNDDTNSSSARPSQTGASGRRSRSENNPNMYNSNQSNASSTRPSQSRQSDRRSENSPNMYNNTPPDTSSTRRDYSRGAGRRAENNSNVYSSNQTDDYRSAGPSQPAPSDRPSYQKYEPSLPKYDNNRQTKDHGSPPEVPFTARERMWTDGPEEARQLREAMERLERAAAANIPKTPPTPEFMFHGSPPRASNPDADTGGFGSDKRDFNSSARNFTPGSTRNFTSDTRDIPSSARDFSFDTNDFGSGARNFSSSTRRNFSPGVSPDFVPPYPANFGASPPPAPGFAGYRDTSPWEHPCGPFCNEFCPDRADHIAREIVEIDSEEERQIEAAKNGDVPSRRKPSGERRRKASSSAAFRLALIRLPRPGMAVDNAPSPAKSSTSTYYTASETSCH